MNVIHKILAYSLKHFCHKRGYSLELTVSRAWKKGNSIRFKYVPIIFMQSKRHKSTRNSPIRTKIRSQGNMVASREATKLPTWAINTLRAILLKNVLFPPRLGPVIMQKRLSCREKTKNEFTNKSKYTSKFVLLAPFWIRCYWV